MKVLFVSVEMNPLAKVGGLADVAGSLPKALRQAGHDVRLVMPRHRQVDLQALGAKAGPSIAVGVAGGGEAAGNVFEASVGGVPVYLLDLPALFDRPHIYGEQDDNARWVGFCDAALAWLAASDWQPEVLHLNDWHAAFVASRLRARPDLPQAALPRVFTIHNLAIHGDFDDAFAGAACLDARVLESSLTSERWVTRCGMGQGILWSDAINTVSPTYAREILTPEYGAGLDPLLRARERDLSGILNGIDYEEFDPATDQRLFQRFDAEQMEGHRRNKAMMQRRLGLAENAHAALVGMVTRLFYQKGADLAAEAVEALLARGRPLQFAVLGTGDRQYHDQLLALQEKYPLSVSVTLAFDADLAQQIYGGTDLFLMPSRFEPCGLGQMIALRYGSVPVVRRTGGLADTVDEWTDTNGMGNGFVFDEADAHELEQALERALAVFARPNEWRRLVQRAMAEDNSWGGAAQEYVRLYEQATRAAVAPGAGRGR
ncbi:MAG TPA: glycogen synthase [Dehalococcoidia bacterium]|nr:glycogen synthase [Dehalococcoidia bacterium]